ncbi:MAG: type II toxin-antitoxin system Phd/YefM family antitoxin [Verrucomicrobia bacterium]|nr:type II toxin-antitoxin system Phd/YefM family antitoxin [Verrucomicrobiota bacterium]MCH8513560.1 type II toxin-antitoxin system Phd/YefM family antitoxin [Kiritimatiellia bacterium]
MDSVNASYFKTHFGEVMGRASRRAVRITRRGRDAAVLISEEEYHQLQRRAVRPSAAESSALHRLQRLADTSPESLENLTGDPRAEAILAKHSPVTKSR